MNAALAKALIVLALGCVLLVGAAIFFIREKHAAALLQLLGATGLTLVGLTHVFEALHMVPCMNWGAEHSPGHYLDLLGALSALILFPLGYVLQALRKRST